MDIYRYFHPHHNPRLHSTPLREQELNELEQAAAELKKALERAQMRTERAKNRNKILPCHFTDMIKAMRFVESSLQTLCDAHEGDEKSDLHDLVEERSILQGWQTWTRLLQEQLGVNGDSTDLERAEPRFPEAPDEDEEIDNGLPSRVVNS